MLKSWSIQNFKPILDSGELQLKPVTILAGRNSSGKSSLIQSILMVAQTLSNPLPERALLPNERIVQLGTYEDVLCEFSGSKDITLKFDLYCEIEDVGQNDIDLYRASHHNLEAIFTSTGNIDAGISAIESSKVTVDHIRLSFTLEYYGPDYGPDDSSELVGEIRANRSTERTFLGELILHNGGINTTEAYGLELSHFLPSDIIKRSEKDTGSTKVDADTRVMSDIIKLIDEEQAFNSAKSFFSDTTQDITRFFTSKIRYLGPFRPDPGATQRSFAPTSQLDEVGKKGEYAAVVYHYNQLAQIDWYNPYTGQVERGTLKNALDAWVGYLEVADEVTTEEAGGLGVAWKVVVKSGRKPRTLPEVGGGLNHLLPILVMGLLSPKHTLLIIEEPEVTLHPSVQARLGDFFMGLAKCGKQCLIETHSENLVSQLRYHIVQAGGMEKSDCMIYFVDQDEQGAAKFEKVEISAKGNILNWPDGFFDETMLQEGRITTASLRKRAKKASDD